MAIYHLRFGLVQRAKGQSAVAVAADRARVRLHDQRLDRMQAPLPAKRGTMPILSKVLLPDGAPARWHNREVLWNEVEAVEVRKDAQLAREIEFALPRELDQADGIQLAREFVRGEFVDRGMIADLNVHWDIGADGMPKPHAHVMLSTRSVGEHGFGPKVRDWNRTDLLERWRG